MNVLDNEVMMMKESLLAKVQTEMEDLSYYEFTSDIWSHCEEESEIDDIE